MTDAPDQERRFVAAVGALGSRRELDVVRGHLLMDWASTGSREEREQVIARARRVGIELARRNFVRVATPGVIADEIRTTDGDITALGRDIYTAFCRPFQEAQRLAVQAFRARVGREPGVSQTPGQADKDWAVVWATIGVAPGSVEVEQKCFQGQFLKQFRAFLKEWDGFKNDHEHWYERMWGSTMDAAIAYRRRVIGFRKKFEELGGTPTTPEPTIPDTSLVPWGKVMTALGLVAALTIVPAVLGVVSSWRRTG